MNILIADDDRNVLQILTSILEVKKHKVTAVEDGREAVAAFRKKRPDLVILDGAMPRMDGYAAACEIASLARPDKVPVLFLSGESDTVSVARGLAAGAVGYLTKPLSVIELLAEIRAIERELKQPAAV